MFSGYVLMVRVALEEPPPSYGEPILDLLRITLVPPEEGIGILDRAVPAVVGAQAPIEMEVVTRLVRVAYRVAVGQPEGATADLDRILEIGVPVADVRNSPILSTVLEDPVLRTWFEEHGE